MRNKNKIINRILIKEIIKEYLGVVSTITLCLVLLYLSVFVAKFVYFILIFYFLISLGYLIQSFRTKSLYFHIYRTNKSSKEEAKALVYYTLSLYSPDIRNQTENQNDEMNHISEPIYSRKTDRLKIDQYPRSRILAPGGYTRVLNSGLNRKKRLNKFSEDNNFKKIRDDKKRVVVLNRLKWLYDQHEY